jgi:hypothetical protein
MPTSEGKLAAMVQQQDFGRIGSENDFIDLRSQNSAVPLTGQTHFYSAPFW